MNEPASLLHNIGGPSSTFIRWNGLAGATSSGLERSGSAPAAGAHGPADAPPTGSWLHCRHHRVAADGADADADWNRCTELLELARPGHGLREPQARRALLELMDAHLRELDWPSLLVCSTDGFVGVHPNEALVLDHPLTVFVALGKCIGSLWMRDRPWCLAPLNTPTVVRAAGARAGQAQDAQWSCRLWFPEDVPGHLLQPVRAGVERKGMR
ncbi:hypothetical protein [Quisquiliibacterium transsilvanicum]|uniref:Uncharacterized protein n=1 Tax=Quisquiliibacterium transsilvanicum TaxID=1549638 RepID=A0A7W8HF20_9BURK|nr:hypothetical protein [Quisquiliibacterium transsilvanicum]MBB5270904.1 hypothetical protein [Quisquiliibacterium transsilvanicum]